MHRYTPRFIAVVLTFAIGVMASSVWVIYRLSSTNKTKETQSKQSSPDKLKVASEVTTVAFCDLLAHDSDYDQRIVRTEAILTVNPYDRVLSDRERCLTPEPWVGFEFDPAYQVDLNDPIQKQLLELVRADGNSREGSFRVTIIGRFESDNIDTNFKSLKYQYTFRIMRVEKVKAEVASAQNDPR